MKFKSKDESLPFRAIFLAGALIYGLLTFWCPAFGEVAGFQALFWGALVIRVGGPDERSRQRSLKLGVWFFLSAIPYFAVGLDPSGRLLPKSLWLSSVALLFALASLGTLALFLWGRDEGLRGLRLDSWRTAILAFAGATFGGAAVPAAMICFRGFP